MHVKCVLAGVVAAALALNSSVTVVHAQSSQPLVQEGDVRYLGSFAVPSTDGTSGQTGLLTYGGHALGMGADGNTLLIGCHDWEQRLAEVTIPEVGGTASIVQPCRDTGLDREFSGTSKIGGSLVWNDRTIVSGYLYYDASGSATKSHSVLGGGWTRVGTLPVGAVAGYMGVVPPEWRATLGGPAFSGQCCLSIISRTSSGPALSVFDPDQLGSAAQTPSTTLLYYPLVNALSGTIDGRPLSNLATTIGGVAFASGTRSVLFVGRIGTGPYCYGEAAECGDPTNSSKGEHMYPYIHQVWAYDANDLVKVKSGQLRSYQVQPYATWRLTEMDDSGSASMRPGGATFDPVTRRIYVTEAYGDEPRVHVYQLAVGQGAPPTPGQLPPPTPGQLPPPIPGEVCGDGIDNDGDGQIDEGCSSGAPVACSVSSWSTWQAATSWSSCDGGLQTRTERRTRAIVTPAANGGAACPTLEETRNVSQACTATPALPPPGPPTRVSSQVSGSTITLNWLAPVVGGPPSGYVVEVGEAPGQTAVRLPVGLETSLTVPNAGVGSYYVRVRGVNAAGQGASSREVVVSVVANDLDMPASDASFAAASSGTGPYAARVQTVAHNGASAASNGSAVILGSNACTRPSFETGLSAQLIGGGVALWWDAVSPAVAVVSDEASPIQYVLEVGSAPGRTNLGTFVLGRVTAHWTTAPPGVYYARIRPANVCGMGRSSNEIMIRVP